MSYTGSSREAPPEDYFGHGKHMWYASFEALAGDMREMKIAVDWQRFDATGSETMKRARGDQRVLTLEQGERHLLDFVDYAPEEDWFCGRNAAVYVEAGVKEDPALEDERIRYYLYLVIEGKRKQRLARATYKTGSQGERVDLQLPEVRWALPGAAYADGSAAEVLGDFDAEVRGRVRPDGSIAIDLRAHRFLSVVPAGEPRRGGIGDGGRRVVRVQPGEAIELVLPEMQPAATAVDFLDGTSDSDALQRLRGLAEDPSEEWEGYASESGHVLVHLQTFFAETRMSLILEARRVQRQGAADRPRESRQAAP
jgi:hypothetical protein